MKNHRQDLTNSKQDKITARNISQQRRSHSKKKKMEPTQTTQLVHLTKRSNSVVHCTHYHITQEQDSIHYISFLRQQVPKL